MLFCVNIGLQLTLLVIFLFQTYQAIEKLIEPTSGEVLVIKILKSVPTAEDFDMHFFIYR